MSGAAEITAPPAARCGRIGRVSEPLDPRRWRALAVCGVALFTTQLDVSIVTVALVSIGRDTGAGPAELQWVVSGYAPAFGMVPLLAAGLGGGVVTPNQALSLAEVDVAGGSTAGGTLQTAQRVGNAAGAAVISAVFYAAARGAAPSGAAREQHYGHAYALALVVSVAFALAASTLTIRDLRHRRRGRA